MKEMTPLEAAEILESKYNIHGPLETVTEELEARAVATSFLRKIADGEIRKVVHGRWIKRDDGVNMLAICSNCKYPEVWWHKTKFCPNCGAKMGDCHD